MKSKLKLMVMIASFLTLIFNTGFGQKRNGIKGEVTRGRTPDRTSEVAGEEKLNKNAREVCVTRTISLDESPQSEIGFLITSGDHTEIYPGAVFKSTAFTAGTGAKPNLNHNTFNLTIDLQSSTAGNPMVRIIPDKDGYLNKGTIAKGVNQLLRDNQHVGNAAQFSYTLHKIEHQKDLDIMAYGAFSGFGASMKVKLNYNRKTKKNMYVVRFHQKYYSLFVDSRNIINTRSSVDKIKSEDVYISEVTYGRIGFIRVESNFDEEAIRVALDATFNNPSYNAALGGNVGIKTIHREWKFTAYAVGGDAGTFNNILGFEGWMRKSKWNPSVDDIPVAYKLKFLDNNQIADVRMTTTTVRRECRPYTATRITFLGLGYLNIVNNHDHGDCSRIGLDVHVEMFENGEKVNGRASTGDVSSEIVSWNEFNGLTNGKKTWSPKHLGIVKLHANGNNNKQGSQLTRELKYGGEALEFVIDQNELARNTVKFRIKSNVRSCHKSCGHCGGLHCNVKIANSTGIHTKEFYLNKLLGTAGNTGKVKYFDTGIINGTGNHTWKLYFKVENF